jgi:4-alpha-glucanotransferase
MLSLEIQSMPKAFGVEFGDLSKNPYLSVATISTHDMSPLREWWEEDYERSQRYFNESLQIDGVAPKKLPGWLCEKIVNRHLYCPSMLCLLSLQDWLSIDESVRNPDSKGERINIPSNPRHYWRWRMHLTVNDLKNNKGLSCKIKEMIEHAGR